MSSHLNLILEPDNPYNTNIHDDKDGRILYQVMTEHGQEIVTKVKNIEGDIIACWQWRDPRPDIIALGTGQPVPLGAWLKKSMMPFKESVTFEDGIGRHFKWKGLGTAPLPLELYSEDNKKHPIAQFVKSHSIFTSSPTDPSPSLQRVQAKLLVDERGQQILDLVVVSFLVLEKNRRAIENATTMVGR